MTIWSVGGLKVVEGFDGDGTRITLTGHGMYLPGQERPEWREQGTSEQLDTLALEFDAVGEAKDK